MYMRHFISAVASYTRRSLQTHIKLSTAGTLPDALSIGGERGKKDSCHCDHEHLFCGDRAADSAKSAYSSIHTGGCSIIMNGFATVCQ